MPNINKVILAGNLGRNPKNNSTEAFSICTFPLATTRKKKNGDKKTDWHNIKAFGKTADFALKYLKKGASVFLIGQNRLDSWEDNEGNKKYFSYVAAVSIEAIKYENEDKTAPAENKNKTQNKPAEKHQEFDQPVEDDDLPF